MTNSVANYPIINIPFLYKYGLTIQNSTIATQTKLSILSGTCRDSQDIIDIRLGDLNPNQEGNTTTAPVRIDNTLIGAGGLDEDTLLANTMYAIYIIADSRGYLPISAIATLGINIFRVGGPSMPAGYDSQRLIGFWATDNSKFWLTGYYSGLGNNLIFTYDVPQLTPITTGSSNTYAYVDLYNFVPNVQNTPVSISTIFLPGLAGDTLILATGASTAINGQEIITGQVASVNVTTISQILAQHILLMDFPFPKPVIQYKVSGTDTVAIYVAGFSVSV